MPQTRNQNTEVYFLQLWKLQVQDQDASGLDFWWGLSSQLAEGNFSLCPHMAFFCVCIGRGGEENGREGKREVLRHQYMNFLGKYIIGKWREKKFFWPDWFFLATLLEIYQQDFKIKCTLFFFSLPIICKTDTHNNYSILDFSSLIQFLSHTSPFWGKTYSRLSELCTGNFEHHYLRLCFLYLLC